MVELSGVEVEEAEAQAGRVLVEDSELERSVG